MIKKRKKLQNMSTKVWRRKKVRQRVFENLKTIKKKHLKVRDICYYTLKIQYYMNSHTLQNHEVTLLFLLWSSSVRNVATNFGQQKEWSLGWMVCSMTKGNQGSKVAYNDIYGGLQKQVPIVKFFAQLE